MKNEEINKKIILIQKPIRATHLKALFSINSRRKIVKIKNKFFYNIVAHLKIRAGQNLFLEKKVRFLEEKKVSTIFFFKI